MTERAEELRALLDQPASRPRPLDELHDRVDARRRRRARRRMAATGLAALAAAVAVVPLLDRPAGGPTQIVAGPGPTETTVADRSAPATSSGTRLDVPTVDGWTTLFAAGESVVMATRPLSDADRALALLARDDVAFTAFPADAVVVVVGGDPTQAKYTAAPDGSMIAPGPAYALGQERVLAGGVKVRRGDIPRSIVRIASYAGPSAPNNRLREAEGIAAGVRLVPGDTPSVPPPGSRPGLPNGALPVPEAGLPEVVRTPASGSTLVLYAGQNCAYLEWADAQRTLPGHQALAGACGTASSPTGIESFGAPAPVMRGPGTSPSTVVIFRVGTQIRRVTARLAGGGSVTGAIGDDGWGLVASEGRIVALTGYDVGGRTLPEVLVG